MMAHWAEIDEDNVVTRVLATGNDDPAGDEGYSWLVETLGGRWVQTSYNRNFRVHFAGIGFTYNEALDVFVPPKPSDSYVLNVETVLWEPPTGYSNDEDDEAAQ